MLLAIPEEFHSDIFRSIREKLSEVDTKGLAEASASFPEILKSVLSKGLPIKAGEKSNLVRRLLCTALEANNRSVLEMFVELGRSRVADYIKASDQPTKELLKGCMETFSKAEHDRAFFEAVNNVVNGKRQLKKWLPFTPFFINVDTPED